MSNLLTRQQAAKRLGVSTATIDRLAARGELHRVELPGRGDRKVLRFAPTEIDALIHRAAGGFAPPIDQPIKISQGTALHAKLSALVDHLPKEERYGPMAELKRSLLELVSEHFGRSITSSNQLTYAEAHWALDLLADEPERLGPVPKPRRRRPTARAKAKVA